MPTSTRLSLISSTSWIMLLTLAACATSPSLTTNQAPTLSITPSVPASPGSEVTEPIHMPPTGRIAFVLVGSREDSRNGLYIVEANGINPKQVASIPHAITAGPSFGQLMVPISTSWRITPTTRRMVMISIVSLQTALSLSA